MRSSLLAVVQLSRAPFLLLTLVVLVLALAVLDYTGLDWTWRRFWLVALGGLAAHVAVNVLNEYADFKSGLDLHTVKTPFSGGSGCLPAQPAALSLAFWLAVCSVATVVLVGVVLLSEGLFWLLPMGLAGLALLFAYTPYINRYPLACLVAPGAGFGLLMFNAAVYALAGEIPLLALLLSLHVFALVNALLLLNQFPDVLADAAVGRRHYPIAIGRRRSLPLLAAMLLGAYAVLLSGIVLAVVPLAVWPGFLSVPLALRVLMQVRHHADEPASILLAMGQNVAVVLLTPALVAAGLLIF